MPVWNPDQYLKFADERGRPCQDLVTRIDVAAPARVVDLGCGPGNSTATVVARWPAADVIGVDNSPEMIAKARASAPGRRWVVADIGAWASEPGDSFDVVFSNAALQWVPDHADLLPRLFGRVARGGALAFQMPANHEAPAHEAMRALAASPAWRGQLEGRVRGWRCEAPAVYYDLVAPHAARVDIWTTEYLHVLPSVEAIVEWYRGSGMRPFLQALASEDDRERFAADYLAALKGVYPPQPDGRVLFPFRRLFVIAYRR